MGQAPKHPTNGQVDTWTVDRWSLPLTVLVCMVAVALTAFLAG